jgi:hypothetical protein
MGYSMPRGKPFPERIVVQIAIDTIISVYPAMATMSNAILAFIIFHEDF